MTITLALLRNALKSFLKSSIGPAVTKQGRWLHDSRTCCVCGQAWETIYEREGGHQLIVDSQNA